MTNRKVYLVTFDIRAFDEFNSADIEPDTTLVGVYTSYKRARNVAQLIIGRAFKARGDELKIVDKHDAQNREDTDVYAWTDFVRGYTILIESFELNKQYLGLK